MSASGRMRGDRDRLTVQSLRAKPAGVTLQKLSLAVMAWPGLACPPCLYRHSRTPLSPGRRQLYCDSCIVRHSSGFLYCNLSETKIRYCDSNTLFMSVGHGFLSMEPFLYYNSSAHSLSSSFLYFHTSHSCFQLESIHPDLKMREIC